MQPYLFAFRPADWVRERRYRVPKARFVRSGTDSRKPSQVSYRNRTRRMGSGEAPFYGHQASARDGRKWDAGSIFGQQSSEEFGKTKKRGAQTCIRLSRVRCIVTQEEGEPPLLVIAIMRASSSSLRSFNFLIRLSMANLENSSDSPPLRWHIRLWTIFIQASDEAVDDDIWWERGWVCSWSVPMIFMPNECVASRAEAGYWSKTYEEQSMLIWKPVKSVSKQRHWRVFKVILRSHLYLTRMHFALS